MKYHSGRYHPTHEHKYKGNLRNIVYRSSWELKFMRWCDFREDVLEWSSEEIIIPYRHPIDGQRHRYFPDFYVKMRTKSGEIEECIIEIKPEHQTKEPTRTSTRLSRRYIKEVMTYATNEYKWEAARDWCTRKGYKFIILTEKQLAI